MIACPACGERLLDELGPDTVKVEGERFRLRRGSDYVACESCGSVHRVGALRAAAAARGDLTDEVRPSRSASDEHSDEVVVEIIEALSPDDERSASEPPSTED